MKHDTKITVSDLKNKLFINVFSAIIDCWSDMLVTNCFDFGTGSQDKVSRSIVRFLLLLDLAADLVSAEHKEDHGADEEEGHQGEEDDVTFTEGI